MTGNTSLALDYITMQRVLERLISIIRKESQQIEVMQVLHLSEHAQEKQQLEVYLNGCKQLIIQNPSVMRAIPDDVKSELNILSQQFDAELRHHHRQLLKIRKVQSLLMGMVQNSVKNKLFVGGGYTKNGSLDRSQAHESYTPPVSLNTDC